MCNKHRSDVLRLGQPPTLAELDARRFRHKFIFDRLVVTYNDDEDDDCIILAFPEDEYWDQVGIDADYAKKYDVLTSKDFSLVMGYINHHIKLPIEKTNNQAIMMILSNLLGHVISYITTIFGCVKFHIY